MTTSRSYRIAQSCTLPYSVKFRLDFHQLVQQADRLILDGEKNVITYLEAEVYLLVYAFFCPLSLLWLVHQQCLCLYYQVSPAAWLAVSCRLHTKGHAHISQPCSLSDLDIPVLPLHRSICQHCLVLRRKIIQVIAIQLTRFITEFQSMTSTKSTQSYQKLSLSSCEWMVRQMYQTDSDVSYFTCPVWYF